MVNDSNTFLPGFILGVLLTFIIFGAFASNNITEMEAHAVKCGAAEWRVNQATGQTTFHWKDELEATK